MRNAFFCLVLASLAACSGSDGAQGPAGPPGTGGGNGSDGGPGPSHAPAGISFEDDDYAQGSISGTISVQKASDESDVTSYAVYWGSNATDKIDLTPVFEVNATGQDISFPYEGLVPPGATTLLAFAKNANGESTPAATTGSVDHYFVQVDVSNGDAGYVSSPVIALDTKNGKVVIAVQDVSNKPTLFICNYDGTGCAQKDASAGQPAGSMYSPSIAIDSTNGKIRVAAVNATGSHLAYFTCDLDGTGCTYADLSTATSQGAVSMPDIAIDPATNQLWVVVRNDGSSGEPDVFHCALDATGCAHHLYAVLAANSGQNPSIAVDVPGNKLYVGGTDGADALNAEFLFGCAADGTACGNDSFAQEFLQVLGPSITIDAPSHRLYFASKTQNDSDVLTVCDVTTVPGYNACTPNELFTGDERNIESVSTSVKFDPVHQKVLVATSDAEDGYRGAFYRCNADGGGCKKSALSALVGGGIHPKIAIDPATGQFFIAMENRGGQTEGITAAAFVYLK